MRPLFAVPIGLALATMVASAQENPAPPITPPPAPTVALAPSEKSGSDEPEITLETLIQRARDNSPRLQIARQNLAAATGRAQSLRAFPGPTLQLVPGIGGNSNARDEEVLLAQPLDVFGARRARAKIGAAEVRRAEAESRLAARTLEVEVKGAAAPATGAQVGGELVVPNLVVPDLSTRPDLASAQATLETRQAQVQALRRDRLPQVELQARRAPFFGRDGGGTAVRAVVTVPLFDFGALRGQRRAAQAEVSAQAATLKLLNQRAAAQVEIARTQLQSRRENVLCYQSQILPLTLDLLRKTQVGYAQGASTYLEVLEAQRTLRQIQTKYLQSLVGVQTGETALDAAISGGFEPLEDLSQSAPRGDAR